MDSAKKSLHPLSAPVLAALVVVLYLIWPAVGLPAALLSPLATFLPFSLLGGFNSWFSFAVFYGGMGLLLQLAAGRRPNRRLALAAVLIPLGLVLARALAQDLAGLFISSSAGAGASLLLSLADRLLVLAGMALLLCQAMPGGLSRARHTFRGRVLLAACLLVLLLCVGADYGISSWLLAGNSAVDAGVTWLGMLDNMQLWETVSRISGWINRGWPELLLWLAVCLPARRQAGE